MARKRGALSTEEERLIRENIEKGRDFEEIGIMLNRTPQTIKKYCDKEKLTYAGMSEDVYDDTLLRVKLEERPYWKQVQQQFNDEELEYFVKTWVNMIKQFREDILYSEELQVKQWITLEIMANKVMKDRKAAEAQADRLEADLELQRALPEELREVDLIIGLEKEIAMARSAQGSFTTEFVKIIDKTERTQRDLRAVRADRVKKIEDSKTSFSGFLKSLEDENIRARLGEDLEINRMGKDEAKKRLSEWHKYEDGQVDQPFLTPETAKNE